MAFRDYFESVHIETRDRRTTLHDTDEGPVWLQAMKEQK
jgi:hypothetical protein